MILAKDSEFHVQILPVGCEGAKTLKNYEINISQIIIGIIFVSEGIFPRSPVQSSNIPWK